MLFEGCEPFKASLPLGFLEGKGFDLTDEGERVIQAVAAQYLKDIPDGFHKVGVIHVARRLGVPAPVLVGGSGYG